MTDTKVDWRNLDLLHPTEEHRLLRGALEEFVREEVEPQAEEFNREERFNLDLFRTCGELGYLGVTVPAADGGAGMDATAAVIIHEMLSTADPGFCLAYLAHAILFVNNFAVNANADQKDRYLDKVLSGEWVGGMCMSEPGCGTDVLAMETRAERKGDHYVLNGRKMWITNGAIDKGTPGDIFLVYAKTGPNRQDVSSFVVTKEMPGFSLGQKLNDKCGMRASVTAELCFDDCEVPLENRLGDEGESLLHMMRNLELERLTLAAMSLGIGLRSLEEMTRYSNERTSFGRPINEFGQIQRHIAESFAELRAARLYVYDTARRMQLGKSGHRLDSDGVKLFAAPVGKAIADRAMQVMGGYGYMGEQTVERLWRDAKLLEIGGGTLEAHQKNITRDLCRAPKQIWE